MRAVYEPFYFFSEDGERYIYFNQYPHDTLEIGMVEIYAKASKRVVLQGYGIYEDLFKWSPSHDKFAIILYRIEPAAQTSMKVVLKIDFTKMEMEILENSVIGDILEEK